MNAPTPPRRTVTAALAGLAIVGVAMPTTGCNRQMFEATMGALTLAAATIDLVSAVASIARSDDPHMHGSRCGHERAHVDGRAVYFSNGYWEFYDDYDGTWYVYPNGLPEY